MDKRKKERLIKKYKKLDIEQMKYLRGKLLYKLELTQRGIAGLVALKEYERIKDVNDYSEVESISPDICKEILSKNLETLEILKEELTK